MVYATGINTFFGRAAALISATNNVANIQKVMTTIGGVCLVTIGLWCAIELAIQFGVHKHSCYMGAGEWPTCLPINQNWVQGLGTPNLINLGGCREGG